MNMTRFRELLRRDGWLYAAIALCVVLAPCRWIRG